MATLNPKVTELDRLLGEYYASKERTDYFDSNNNGKLMTFCNELGWNDEEFLQWMTTIVLLDVVMSPHKYVKRAPKVTEGDVSDEDSSNEDSSDRDSSNDILRDSSDDDAPEIDEKDLPFIKMTTMAMEFPLYTKTAFIPKMKHADELLQLLHLLQQLHKLHEVPTDKMLNKSLLRVIMAAQILSTDEFDILMGQYCAAHGLNNYFDQDGKGKIAQFFVGKPWIFEAVFHMLMRFFYHGFDQVAQRFAYDVYEALTSGRKPPEPRDYLSESDVAILRKIGIPEHMREKVLSGGIGIIAVFKIIKLMNHSEADVILKEADEMYPQLLAQIDQMESKLISELKKRFPSANEEAAKMSFLDLLKFLEEFPTFITLSGASSRVKVLILNFVVFLEVAKYIYRHQRVPTDLEMAECHLKNLSSLYQVAEGMKHEMHAAAGQAVCEVIDEQVDMVPKGMILESAKHFAKMNMPGRSKNPHSNPMTIDDFQSVERNAVAVALPGTRKLSTREMKQFYDLFDRVRVFGAGKSTVPRTS